jgi:hypothetical protein
MIFPDPVKVSDPTGSESTTLPRICKTYCQLRQDFGIAPFIEKGISFFSSCVEILEFTNLYFFFILLDVGLACYMYILTYTNKRLLKLAEFLIEF